MNFLIIGNGGREHAICKKLINCDCHLFYYGQYENFAMSDIAKLIGIGSLTDYNNIVDLSLANKIHIVFIGPELPLSVGLSDEFAKVNIACIGPRKALAKIETSKIFARRLMLNNNMEKYCPKILSILRYDDPYNKNQILESIGDNDIVIKADGLHSGKGVKVQGDHFMNIDEGLSYCCEILNNKEDVIIEEKLVGEEFSLMSFCDGVTLKHMIPVKDYKRVYDDDQGPNCGSMGSITGALWFLNDQDIKICHYINEIIIKLLQRKTKLLYKGILYGSFIKTKNKQIKVIEFNARFGDPECINILHLLETNLLDIFGGIITGTLDKVDIKFRNEMSIFKYLVPIGYPDKSIKGEEVIMPNNINSSDIIIANLECKNNKYYTMGSRILGCIYSHIDLNVAVEYVNDFLNQFTGQLFYRKDIGSNISLSYTKAGVNIEEKNEAINDIATLVKSTYTNNVISKFGDFNGIIKLDNNFIVTSTDGVGTKSILVLEQYGPELGFELLGRDLVNLNINDILVAGATPLFFLDYFGCGKLNKKHLKYFIKGITEGCKEHNCVLLKGETAIMPDIYQENKYDLVGTVIGYLNEDTMIHNKNNIREGDIVLGLKSFGFQTNGFTLIRKILNRLQQYDDINKNIMDQICAPHRSYYNDILSLRKANVKINGLCHISGGGLLENPPRILPGDLHIEFDFKYPDIFSFIQEKGVLNDYEMMKTFNCGYGFLVIINSNEYDKVQQLDIAHDVIGIVHKTP